MKKIVLNIALVATTLAFAGCISHKSTIRSDVERVRVSFENEAAARVFDDVIRSLTPDAGEGVLYSSPNGGRKTALEENPEFRREVESKVFGELRAYAESFVADVGVRPGPKYTIDRKNNDGNYEPGNIRWATKSEQARNTRFNRLLTACGKTQTLEEWAIETGLPKSTLFNRLRRGWPDDKVIETPAQPKAPNHTLFPVGGYQRCVELGINHQTVASRLRRGWTFERALTAPIDHRRSKYARLKLAS